MSDSKSIHQKDIGIGTVKNYKNGTVGLQLKGQDHSVYAESMKSLPKNGDQMLTKYFGPKNNS